MRWGAFRAAMVGFTALAGCAEHRPAAPSDPPPPAIVSGLDLQVAVAWAGPVDLDLYVTQPDGETVYFANNPSRHGARLESDVKCDPKNGRGPHVERVRVPSPLAGRYRVGVDFIDDCGTETVAASYRAVVDLNGTRREAVGIVELERFQPIVLEIDVKTGENGAEIASTSRRRGDE